MPSNGADRRDESGEVSGRMIVTMVLLTTLGFSAHRARPLIQEYDTVWATLISYAVGYSMLIAVFPMMFAQSLSHVGSAEKTQNVFLAFVSLVLSAGAIGFGVVVGWLVDPDISEE